ncbi:MAG: restriction endonuclease [Actinomycetota bacterium]|nr:restriction endonuclease [Actinomycetota bacterium]
MTEHRYIIKKDGEKELYSKGKIRRSLLKAGTEPEIVEYIIAYIEKNLQKVSKSKDIYRLVLHQLKKKQPVAAIKYTLKEAIMDIGPTGFTFERYFAKLMEHYGYQTQVGTIVKGFCVEHEIDVIAHKDQGHFMVECKYHNHPGSKSDLKTVLYIYARFLDLKKGNRHNSHPYQFSQAWLATNTKCTTEAIKYAQCVNLNLIAWHYPEEKNLEYYIEYKKLYPISILPELKKKEKQKLFESNIYTIQDFLKTPPSIIAEILSTDQDTVDKLFARAALLLL